MIPESPMVSGVPCAGDWSHPNYVKLRSLTGRVHLMNTLLSYSYMLLVACRGELGQPGLVAAGDGVPVFFMWLKS